MDNLLERAEIVFIKNLTGASAAEIQEYAAEIIENRKFHDSIEVKLNSYGKRDLHWYYGISGALGIILYVICRAQKPDSIIETGVARGASSSYILGALEVNQHGDLYSIDVPLQQNIQSGWMIPDYLRHRWRLTQGKSSNTLAPLLKKAKEIDIFFHDSEHTYNNMLWEYNTAWVYIKTGGLLLSHNITDSDAFPDFCRNRKVEGITLGMMGGIKKH